MYTTTLAEGGLSGKDQTRMMKQPLDGATKMRPIEAEGTSNNHQRYLTEQLAQHNTQRRPSEKPQQKDQRVK